MTDNEKPAAFFDADGFSVLSFSRRSLWLNKIQEFSGKKHWKG